MDNVKYKRSFPIKFKVNENQIVLEFANKQKNFQDTIRYLIEKEIAENGIRNLQTIIPNERDCNYFNDLFSTKNSSNTNQKNYVTDIKLNNSDDLIEKAEIAVDSIETINKIIIEDTIHVPGCYD